MREIASTTCTSDKQGHLDTDLINNLNVKIVNVLQYLHFLI